MEGNGGQHHIDRTGKALEEAGVNWSCPSCGHSEWFRNPNPVVLKETRPVEVDEVGAPIAGELFGGISAYLLICRRCGFLRLHNVTALLGDSDAG